MRRDKAFDIGEALVAEGLLSSLQMEESRRESEEKGGPLQRVLMEMNKKFLFDKSFF